MIDPLATAISLLALGVSGLTAWLTLFRRGTVQMTQPMVIFLDQMAPTILELAHPPKYSCGHLFFLPLSVAG